MVSTGKANIVIALSFLVVCFPTGGQTAACGFATFSYIGSCTYNCPEGHIGNTTSRECQTVNSADIHPDGYTVNATKYEAVAFVDDVTMMVQGGTYLLTIKIIPTTLDINEVLAFITSIVGNGTESVDFQGIQGASTDLIVLRTVNPIPLGNYAFTIGLMPFSNTLSGTFTKLEREVELWILPPAEPCSSTLCSNGGLCSDVVIADVPTFSCNCAPGWTGPTCSDDIDFCASQPCSNGGICIDVGNGYTCNCPGNYTGPACADIDHCAVHTPCQNDGQCVNNATTYSCICLTGWTGQNCTDDVDECRQASVCQNGGNCTNTNGTYNCSCAPLYTGANCEILMSCPSNLCENSTAGEYPSPTLLLYVFVALIAADLGVILIVLVVGCSCCCCLRNVKCTLCINEHLPVFLRKTYPILYACAFATFSYMGSCTSSCPEGLIGNTTSRECQTVNSADIHPDGYTVNATKYEAVAFVDDVTMMVQGGTYLLTIKIIPDSLDISEVLAFITSIDGNGTESVDFQGIQGASTDLIVLRTVNPIPLGNYAFTIGLMPFSNTLSGTFTKLEREVELWILPPATCAFATFSYMGSCTSNCPEGLIGNTTSRECQTVNSADIHPDGYTVNATKYEAVAFVDDVTMMVQGGTYLLTIKIIPTTLDINEVLAFITSIVGNGTESVDFQGIQGASTDLIVLRTVNPIPLGNYAFTIGLMPFSNTLSGTFTKLEREVELWILPPAEPCSSTLCSNGGLCSDVVIADVPTFSCNCAPGWTGPTCSEDIDFCASQPCSNGGTCIDVGNGYTCNCPKNYTGPACADIDHCTVHTPCQNDGQCVNNATTYSCICLTGWTGQNCTDDVDECRQASLCQNGGNCTNTDGSYSCSCAPLYTGANCEMLTSCPSNLCENSTALPHEEKLPLYVFVALIAADLGVILIVFVVGCCCCCCLRTASGQPESTDSNSHDQWPLRHLGGAAIKVIYLPQIVTDTPSNSSDTAALL